MQLMKITSHNTGEKKAQIKLNTTTIKLISETAETMNSSFLLGESEMPIWQEKYKI